MYFCTRTESHCTCCFTHFWSLLSTNTSLFPFDFSKPQQTQQSVPSNNFTEVLGWQWQGWHSQLLFSCLVMTISFAIPWTVACRAPLSMGSPRQEYWSEMPFPSLEGLPDPWIKPMSPTLEEGSLPLRHWGRLIQSAVVQSLSRVQLFASTKLSMGIPVLMSPVAVCPGCSSPGSQALPPTLYSSPLTPTPGMF